jgi:hypothetical protein
MAFLHIIEELTDEEYWPLLAMIWIDSENISQFHNLWISLLTSNRRGRDALMSSEERATLAALPDPVTVYRGFTHGALRGLSWTQDHVLAQWFAHRFARLDDEGPPQVAIGTVAREAILAVFLERRGSESEVVVNPDDVRNLHIKPLPGDRQVVDLTAR